MKHFLQATALALALAAPPAMSQVCAALLGNRPARLASARMSASGLCRAPWRTFTVAPFAR